MNAENHQLLHRTNAVVLVAQPRVRRPRSQELKTVLVAGPLTVVQVKTVKGRIAYMFKSRPTKYAYEDTLKQIAAALFRRAFPESKEKTKARQKRYAQRNHAKELQRKRRHYQNHRQERIMWQRQYRAKQR